MTEDAAVSASGWIKGITLSVIGSLIGGASKLAIRKSWLLQKELQSGIASCGEQRGDILDHEGVASRPLVRNDDGGAIDTVEDDISPALRHRQAVPIDDAEGHALDPSFDYRTTTTPPPVASSSTAGRRNLAALSLRSAGVFGMSFLNPFFGIWALNYASPSVLAPFSGLTLVFVICFSQAVLGEQPYTRQLHAAAFIVLGEVVTAVWGDHTNDEGKTAQDVRDSYKDPVFLLYLITFFICVTGSLYAMYNPSGTVPPRVQRFCWGITSGALAGLFNFLKDAMILIKASKAKTNDGMGTNSGDTWYEVPLLIGVAVVVCSVGLGILTVCMKRYDAIYSSSMFVGSLVVSASIMSAIHYDTFAHLHSAASVILYPTGLAILMVGVCMLATTTSTTENEAALALGSSLAERTEEVLMVGKRKDPGTSSHLDVGLNQETNGILA